MLVDVFVQYFIVLFNTRLRIRILGYIHIYQNWAAWTRKDGQISRSSVCHFGRLDDSDILCSNPDRVKPMTLNCIHVANDFKLYTCQAHSIIRVGLQV